MKEKTQQETNEQREKRLADMRQRASERLAEEGTPAVSKS